MIKFKVSNNTSWESHRYGWKYVMSLFSPYLDEDGIILDGFIDASFGFLKGRFLSQGIIPYNERWIGFWHHPVNISPWVDQKKTAPDFILSDLYFKQSLKQCIAIFTFSEYLAEYLRERIPNVNFVPLIHPTGFEQKEFNFNKFLKNKKLLHVGSWLRRMTSFYKFKCEDYQKYLLLGESGYFHIIEEANYYNFDLNKHNDVKYLTFLKNDLYDDLMSESIIFLDLYDSSVNNTVLECIARGTPIIINRLPATVEYLGDDYPLFYNDLADVPILLKDYTKIDSASNYLKTCSIRTKITPEYFINSFLTACNQILKTNS